MPPTESRQGDALAKARTPENHGRDPNTSRAHEPPGAPRGCSATSDAESLPLPFGALRAAGGSTEPRQAPDGHPRVGVASEILRGERCKNMQNGYEGIDRAAMDTLRLQAQGAARKSMIRGLLWCVGGVGVSIVAYAGSNPGERYPVFWGAAIFGGYQFLRGLYYVSNPMKLLNKTQLETAATVDARGRPTQPSGAQRAHPSSAATSSSQASSPREPAGSIDASGVGTMAALLARLSGGGSAVAVNPWDICWTTAALAGADARPERGVIAVHRMGVVWATQSGLMSNPKSWAADDFFLQTASISSMTVSPPDSIAWSTSGFRPGRVVAPGGNWLKLTNGEGRTFSFGELPDDARTKEVLHSLELLLPPS